MDLADKKFENVFRKWSNGRFLEVLFQEIAGLRVGNHISDDTPTPTSKRTSQNPMSNSFKNVHNYESMYRSDPGKGSF